VEGMFKVQLEVNND